MASAFDHDTYVCLDLPSSVAEQVLAIRRAQRDEFRAALPAEITVAGSSGVGPIAPDQDPQEAFARLDAIAAQTPPIEASFRDVVRFPNTDIFVLALKNQRPFRALHERIATSGLRFKPTPFSDDTPHCTLRSRSPVTEEEAAELLALRIPEPFVIDTMSVYRLDKLPMTLLHRSRLTGTAEQETSSYQDGPPTVGPAGTSGNAAGGGERQPQQAGRRGRQER
ncbi:MAG: 2'-5' RNA ligase family protein [Chloroflexota bacterium]